MILQQLQYVLPVKAIHDKSSHFCEEKNIKIRHFFNGASCIYGRKNSEFENF